VIRVERHPLGGALVHALVPATYTSLIFVGGSAPADPSSLQVNDKVAHAVVFFGLALACAPLAGHWLIHRQAGRQPLRGAVWCAVYSVLVGGLLELWQSRIPHRTADVWDWVADAVGAVLAAIVLAVVLPRYLTWRSQPLA
jgi:VanZ family protein